MRRTTLTILAPILLLAVASPAAGVIVPGTAPTHDHELHDHGGTDLSPAHLEEHRKHLEDRLPPFDLEAESEEACVQGDANGYPCRNVDLLAFLPLADIGGGSGNDVWGWTDPETGREYALMGRSSGTAFVDITEPTAPVYVGNLPTHTTNSSWRDIKVIADHAYVGSEASSHGLQVFDLSQLRDVDPSAMPASFEETAHYAGFGNSHNLVANEGTHFIYAVGTGTCSGGLHIVDVRLPTAPAQAGCYSADGYTHDAQCVIYRGTDAEHVGKEICFASNEDTLTIVDVTEKANIEQLARVPYAGARYTHQGWLSEDHRWFAVDDELDETGFGHTTRTRYFDLADLDDPVLRRSWSNGNTSIDHNLYVKDGIVYQANYRSGLRIYRFLGEELGHFDIYPSNDNPSFNGAWSVYPFFESGTVVVSGIEQGLFVLRPDLPALDGPPPSPTSVDAIAAQADEGAVTVAGSVTLADHELIVGQDGATDARARNLGAEIGVATVKSEMAETGLRLRFRLTVPDQPEEGGTPEIIRTLWNVAVGDESYILEAAIRAQGTTTGPVLRLLAQDGTALATLQGSMAAGAIELIVPASAIGAGPGNRVRVHPTFGVGSYTSVGDLALDTVSPIDPYVVPAPSVLVGVAPAGTAASEIPLTVAATLSGANAFEASFGDLAPGSYVVAALACHGELACALDTTEVQVP